MEQVISGLNTLLDDSLSRVSENQRSTGSEGQSSRVSDGQDDSSLASSYRSMSTSMSRSRTSRSDPEDDEARRDRFLMNHARLFVMGFLLSAAAVAAFVWWHFDRLRQEELYRENFEESAEKIIRVFLARMEYPISTATAVATGISTTCSGGSESSSTNSLSSWPFCGLPRFERRMAGPRRLARATAVWVSPILERAQQTEWETFAVENAYYLENNFTDPTDLSESPYRTTDWPVANGIFKIQGATAVPQKNNQDADEQQLLAPIWQSSPASLTTNSLAMFDQYAEAMRRTALTSMMELETSVFSASRNEGTDDGIAESYGNGLHLSLYTPVMVSSSGDSSTENTVVAALTMDLDWSIILGSIITGAKAPLSIVLENSLGQTFTLESHNDAVVLIGEGATVCDNQLGLVRSSSYEEFATQVLGMEEDDAMMIMPSDDDEVCYYRIKVYPSMAFEDEFLTKQPIFSGLGVGGIVLAVAAVFLVYDCIIEK
jgi:hypothetical protein